MQDINREALRRLFQFVPVLAALLFLPAGTLNWWQGWLFFAIFFLCVTALTLYLMRYDTALLARRMRAGPRAEKEPSQKIIMRWAMVVIVGFMVIPGLDRRFGWSNMPDGLIFTGEALVVLGFFITFLVLRANSYAAGVIELAPDQKVISSGPYAWIRHPMYSGALIMLLGVPLALGSWPALLLIPPTAYGLAWRLTEEEKFLIVGLPGYDAYRLKVRYRLVPGVW